MNRGAGVSRPRWTGINPDLIYIEVDGQRRDPGSPRRRIAALPSGTEVAIANIGWRGRLSIGRLLKGRLLVDTERYVALPSNREPLILASGDRAALGYFARRLSTVPPGNTRVWLTTVGLRALRLPGITALLPTVFRDIVVIGRRA